MTKKAFLTMIFLFTFTMIQGKTINLATVNWEPFYSENLPKSGYFAEISRVAFERAGYELNVDFIAWNRALEMAKAGQYDGLLGAYYSDERSEFFYYTDSVANSNEVFVQKKGRGIKYTKLEDLKGYRIGTLRGMSYVKELREKGIKVEEVNNDFQNALKLNNNRIDLWIVSEPLFNELMTKRFSNLRDNFEILEKPFAEYTMHNPISKTLSYGEEIVQKFNEALAEMKNDGTYDQILAEFGQK